MQYHTAPDGGILAGLRRQAGRWTVLATLISFMGTSFHTPAQASWESAERCKEMGGIWRDGRCDHDEGPPAFDLFGMAVLTVLGLAALGVFSGDDKTEPPRHAAGRR